MTKDKLIEILQGIDGNPEIKLWNGLVRDSADIEEEVVCQDFVKETEEHIRESMEYEIMFNNEKFSLTEEDKKYIDNAVKSRLESDVWDTPNHFVSEERFHEWYGKERKKVVILQPKIMNRSYSDRLGSIRY